MSILSDLDPTNARIPPATRKHKMAGLIAVSLLLGGATWLYFAVPMDMRRVSEPATTTFLPLPSNSGEPAQLSATASAIAVSDYARLGPALVQSAKTTVSIAQTDRSGEENALQVRLKETAGMEVANATDAQGAPTASSPAPQSKKLSSKPASAKAASLRKTQSNRSAGVQHPGKGETKASERDIEIISAIVR